MFWPDDRTLQNQSWWFQAVWDDGPTYGALLTAVRPAIRAALLLGYDVGAVAFGAGAGVSPADEWQVVRRDTLELVPAIDVSPDKQAAGPSVWLEAAPAVDLTELLAGSYGIDFDFGVFGSDDHTRDGTVPSAITTAVGGVVERAVQALAPMIPSRRDWEANDRLLPRQAGGGLLWILDPTRWYELATATDEDLLPPAAKEVVQVVEELVEAREDFLRGQLLADRALHAPASGTGPANLRFLLGRERFWPGRAHACFWEALFAELQARGEADRLWEQQRRVFAADDAPTWLDVLTELLRLGVVRSSRLSTPGEPPSPLAANAPTGDPDKKITLTVWGYATITLFRETVFTDPSDELSNEGLTGSVAWDYAPGAEQTKPAVIVVAGRGVAIEHTITDLDQRPWTLEIYRVQDDRLVPRLGAQIDTTALLATSQIEPQPNECVFDPADAISPDTTLFPQVMVKPKPDGVTLVYPVSQGVIPEEPFGLEGTPVVPCVIELTVNPLSGIDAYALDVHYYTDLHMNIPENEIFEGGAHVSVWTTGDVSIASFPSGNRDGPAAGNPSGVTRTVATGHLFIAEYWGVEPVGLGLNEPNPLPRPWSTELPTTRWADLFPLSVLQQAMQVVWEELVLQQIQDLFEPFREDPFADEDTPHLAYDHDTRVGTWRDPDSGVNWVLTPEAHRHDDFGAMDSLFFDLADVLVGFMPFVGDAADIGELVYAWQTGRDRWGRPVTDFQLALMMIGSALPFVSSGFVRGAGEILRRLPGAPPGALSLRLFTPSGWADDFPVAEAEAALAQPSVLREAGVASGSKRRAQDTENLVKALAADSADEATSAIASLASRLIDETQDGWLTVDDLVSDDGGGFAIASLQTSYTRFLRNNPGIGPVEWLEAFDG